MTQKKKPCGSCGNGFLVEDLERPYPGSPRLCTPCANVYTPTCAGCEQQIQPGNIKTIVRDLSPASVFCIACSDVWAELKKGAVLSAWAKFKASWPLGAA